MDRKKILKNIGIIVLIVGVIFVSFASLDAGHAHECHNHNCLICNAIAFSQRILISLIVVIVVLKRINFLVYTFLAQIYQKVFKNITILNDLVFRKVQFNE